MSDGKLILNSDVDLFCGYKSLIVFAFIEENVVTLRWKRFNKKHNSLFIVVRQRRGIKMYKNILLQNIADKLGQMCRG